MDFGRGPISNPLLVEAIEDLFVPALVYNNRKGRDAEILEQYNEPSWNNPVIRYLDDQGNDLVPRKELVLTAYETADRMAKSLEKSGSKVPIWLRAVAVPAKRSKLREATFAMF